MANKKSEEFRKEVAKMFVDGLKKDGLNWKKGWSVDDLPQNGKSRIPYKGVNRLNLMLIAARAGYKDPRWMTFNQIRDAGYHLAKGSKGAKIEYWFPYDMVERKPLTWQKLAELIKDGRDVNEFARLVKLYTVFNGDNIEGLPELQKYENKEVKPDEIIRTLADNMGVKLIHSDLEQGAYYRPDADEVHLPLPERFFSTESYNATALHELAHSTGHPTRLGRDQTGWFGSEDYAVEELIAEMTSAFMSVHTGIDPTEMDMDNHQAYVNSWIKAIESSPDVLMKAIKEAEKASDYMEEHAGLSKEVEIAQESANDKSSLIQQFNDKFGRFGVILTPEEEIKAMDSEGNWKTWFDKEGNCRGNTDQLGIWLCDRGDPDLPAFADMVRPTCDEAMTMVNSIAEFYDISIPYSKLGKVIDLEDFAELQFGRIGEKAGELLKDKEPEKTKKDISSKIKEIFSGKEKEDGPLDISKGISSRRYKADELEL